MPLEQLLCQLEVEQSASVIRRLVKLLVNSFHPTGKGADVQVKPEAPYTMMCFHWSIFYEFNVLVCQKY